MNKNQFNEICYSCTNIANASHCTGARGIATVSKYTCKVTCLLKIVQCGEF